MGYRVHIGVALIALMATSAFADKLRVPRDFETLQDAVDAAAPGDEIEIRGKRPGESAIVLGKSDLTIVGKSGAELQPSSDVSGIVIDSSSDITVRGVDFVGGSRGVHILASSQVTVDRCRFSDLGNAGVDARSSSDVTVTRCRVETTSDDGITFGDDDGVEGVTRGEISNCTVVDTPLDGFRIVGTDIVVSRCRAGSTRDGFRVAGIDSARIRIERCRASGATDECFESTAAGVVFERCTAVGAEEEGFDIEGDNCRIEKSKATRCRRGIEFEGVDRGTALKCKIVRPSDQGILVETSDGVVIERCKVSRAGSNGVEIAGDTANTTVTRTKASKSGHVDLRDQTGGSETTYDRNKFRTEDLTPVDEVE